KKTMMIREFELYHGAAIYKIISEARMGVCIRQYEAGNNSSFVLNEKIGLYLKYSTQRMSPWRFTFLKQHQEDILTMKKSMKDVFLLLICEMDGVASLSFDDLKRVLDGDHKETEWIS